MVDFSMVKCVSSINLDSYFANHVLNAYLCLSPLSLSHFFSLPICLPSQQGHEISGRTYAIAKIPDETSSALLGGGLRAEPPLIVSQHVKPAPRFVLLTAQVRDYFSGSLVQSFPEAVCGFVEESLLSVF